MTLESRETKSDNYIGTGGVQSTTHVSSVCTLGESNYYIIPAKIRNAKPAWCRSLIIITQFYRLWLLS